MATAALAPCAFWCSGGFEFIAGSALLRFIARFEAVCSIYAMVTTLSHLFSFVKDLTGHWTK